MYVLWCDLFHLDQERVNYCILFAWLNLIYWNTSIFVRPFLLLYRGSEWVTKKPRKNNCDFMRVSVVVPFERCKDDLGVIKPTTTKSYIKKTLYERHSTKLVRDEKEIGNKNLIHQRVCVLAASWGSHSLCHPTPSSYTIWLYRPAFIINKSPYKFINSGGALLTKHFKSSYDLTINQFIKFKWTSRRWGNERAGIVKCEPKRTTMNRKNIWQDRKKETFI